MATWILTVAALDAVGAAVMLRFADGEYIDGSANFYEPRMIQPALMNVSPNDGGVFTVFNSASQGEIELANLDGGLNYLVDYALDGRTVTLSLVDSGAVTMVFIGTVERMTEGGGSLFLAMKSLTEALSANHPMAVYAGTNTPPTGLEGSTGTIEGSVKPKIFGDCRNLSPVMVNSSLLIYEASSRSDAVITAVYDDGVRLTNYLVNGARAIGQTSIAVDTGVASSSIPTGAKVIFDSHRAIYSVTTGISGAAGTIVISPALTTAIVDNEHVEVVNFYTGSGTAAGQLQNAIAAAAWSSYNGYFRLAASPSKQITCDVMSVTAGGQHKVGDVFAAVAAELGVTVDSASVTTLNSVGVMGLAVTEIQPSAALFDAIARSVGGFYHYIGTTLYMSLLTAPGTPVMTIEEWQIVALEREATGLGSNGLPFYGVSIRYDKIETVQTTVAGATGLDRTELLKNASRTTEVTDAATLSRHPLAEKIAVESLLRLKADAVAVANRLLSLGKVRRDVVTVTAYFSQVPAFNIGDTVTIKHTRLGYSAGRDMVVIGYERDVKKKRVMLRVLG